MNESRSLVGPRGWAFASIAAGVMLAVPFLRKPPTLPSAQSSAVETATAVATFSTVTPAGSNASAATSAATVGWDSRTVAGVLPSTNITESELPAWVTKPSPLDELIEKTPLAASNQESISRAEAITNTTLREFRAWRSPEIGLAPPVVDASPNPTETRSIAPTTTMAFSGNPVATSPFAGSASTSLPVVAQGMNPMSPQYSHIAQDATRPTSMLNHQWPDRRMPIEEELTSTTSSLATTSTQLPQQPPVTSISPGQPSGHGLISATLRHPSSVEGLPPPAPNDSRPRNYVYQPGFKPN